MILICILTSKNPSQDYEWQLSMFNLDKCNNLMLEVKWGTRKPSLELNIIDSRGFRILFALLKFPV